jgi:beta-galactosidase/beta-glucuronidase
MNKHDYPRPQLVRSGWTNLNGPWDFALDPDSSWIRADEVEWSHTIQVPFAPESNASGIGNTGFYQACWYRRSFEAPPLQDGERLVLHFGAVDYSATVWVNGHLVARHEGGYTPFNADITESLQDGGEQTVVVRAQDDPHDLAKPRGKQDWQLEPHSIWYPRTTGIWQTVWLERLPRTSIRTIRWTPDLTNWAIGFEAEVDGESQDGLRVHVRLHIGNHVFAEDTYRLLEGEVHRQIALSDPGIDDYRNELLWSPSQPTLIQAQVELRAPDGSVIDAVRSYTALREVTVQGDRFLLNGRPLKLRMVLDQGYWLDTGQTAPDDDALRRDVELTKAMGFNGVRKHQKIEDPRYLYWADHLGLVVWEEMPSAYRFTSNSVKRLVPEWTAAMERDYSHPCIVAWVPFNESWGVPDLPANPEHRHYVQALYHLTKTLDPTRPVVGNDGWESVATDIIGIHDYDEKLERMAKRYESEDNLERLLTRERPSNRLLTLEGYPHIDHPIMLTEFGGIAFSEDHDDTWGYTRSAHAEEFAEQYAKLLETVRSLKLFAGFCYTQFADTWQESNGLLYADRTPKIPLEVIKRATEGPRTARQEQVEREWTRRRLRMQESYGLTEDAAEES